MKVKKSLEQKVEQGKWNTDFTNNVEEHDFFDTIAYDEKHMGLSGGGNVSLQLVGLSRWSQIGEENLKFKRVLA